MRRDPDPVPIERSALRTTDRDNVWHFGLMAHRMVCRAPRPLGGAGTTPVSERQVPEPRTVESAPADGASTNGASTNDAAAHARLGYIPALDGVRALAVAAV